MALSAETSKPSTTVDVDPSEAFLTDLVHANKRFYPVGITSVCSAHPLVLRAALEHAADSGQTALIEATSNQVDQNGGYTRMRPADFVRQVHELAEQVDLPLDHVILGGDHLGPNTWRSLSADEAMRNAETLVQQYVAAGFTKIHADCTYPCRDDPRVLPESVIAERAVRLIAVAETTARATRRRLTYVIGSEVPTPGGADETIEHLSATTPSAVEATLEAHRAALSEAGLSQVWPQIAALVVQPGVEFDHHRVVSPDESHLRSLGRALSAEPSMAFEAHSTDYQGAGVLRALVQHHWAVLKVGPELTYALREALFALEHIEYHLVDATRRARLTETLEARMLATPNRWESHYHGSPHQQQLMRRFSYSDRVRYYWSDPAVADAVDRLLGNLAATTIPVPLLDQYLPAQSRRCRAGTLAPQPQRLVVDHVRDVLRRYDVACRPEHSSGQHPRRSG